MKISMKTIIKGLQSTKIARTSGLFGECLDKYQENIYHDDVIGVFYSRRPVQNGIMRALSTILPGRTLPSYMFDSKCFLRAML